MGSAARPGKCLIEMEDGDGSKMRIHLKGSQTPDSEIANQGWGGMTLRLATGPVAYGFASRGRRNGSLRERVAPFSVATGHCHELTQGGPPRDAEPTILYDELNPTQVRLLTLLGIDPATNSGCLPFCLERSSALSIVTRRQGPLRP
jgi:hypothetical protein